MYVASFQHSIFLLTVLLYIWILQVHSYKVHVMKDGWGFKILCNDGEHLDSKKLIEETNIIKITNGTKPESSIFIGSCHLPNESYMETLKKVNINASRIAKMFIYFDKMENTYLLRESLFKGMLLKDLKIAGNYFVYDVSIKRSEKLDLAKCSIYNLYCINNHDRLLTMKPLFPNRLKNVSIMQISGCSSQNVSYFDILLNMNIIPSSVQELKLSKKSENINFRPDNFKRLSLRKLSVYLKHNYELETEIFREIAVDELYLSGVNLTMLQKFRVKKVTLEQGTFVGEWGDCSTLTSLELISFDVSQIPDGWLRHCYSLTNLTVTDVSLKGVEKMLMSANALTNLTVQFCKIRELTKPFAEDAVNLRKLTLKDKMLKSISRDAFGALKKLEELDLSWTLLGGLLIMQAITPLENLRKLTLDRNPFKTFCRDYKTYISSTSMNRSIPQRVESLSIRFSPLSKTCFTDWVNLTYLNLSFNRISLLNIPSLPAPYKRPLTVDLSGNPLDRLGKKYEYNEDIEDNDEYENYEDIYESMDTIFKKSQNITIILNWTVKCDCEHTQFIEDIRDLPQINLQNATCTSGERLVDFPGEKLRCYKYRCGSCMCRTSWDDKKTIADCNSLGLHALPAIWNEEYDEWTVVKKILASSNFIKTLPANEYPTTLVDNEAIITYFLFSSIDHSIMEVDLSNNLISHLSENALNALFLGGERRVHLSGNPFLCDCGTQAMIYQLSVHRNQIPDYKTLNCSNRVSYLHELTNFSLCLEQVILILGIVSVSLLALAAIITLLYFRYKLTIKAFLYARGLCLYCVTEEELDADKEYDAFISFAGLDEELVEDELLPGLENDYKLCVHTRDWWPGEMIYTQIFESVEKSRRTVIVLTKNFVQSVWGIVEFRTAYIKALREGRVRVICILVDDDINDMDLAPDLKAYLKSNTYLKWRDPWFWQKLRYALPHPSVTIQSGLPNENGDNRCQEIELASM